MIDTAIKHCIYELCIEKAFDGIFKNFTHQNETFYIGATFSWIKQITRRGHNVKVHHLFHDAVITGIETVGGVTYIYIEYECAAVYKFDENDKLIEDRNVDNIIGIPMRNITYRKYD